MSKFKDFLMQGQLKGQLTSEVELERFPGMPFVLQSITEAEHKRIREGCQKRVTNAKGQTSIETDTSKYMSRLLAACLVEPNLKDAELQDYFGVKGEEALLEALLLAGEFSELVASATALNKGITDINEAIDEAKN